MRTLIILLSFYLSSTAFAGITTSVKWPQGQELKIESQMLVYTGLRHQIHQVPVNNCHKHVLTQAQRDILEPRRACPQARKGERFELIVNGQKQSVEVCSISSPKYQRTLEMLISCDNK